MRSKSEILSAIQNPGLIAVVRARAANQVLPLADALLAGGIRAIEITMTTPDAISCIREAVRHFAGSPALIGVGTVLDPDTCKRTIDAGAEFIVSPIVRPELLPAAQAAGRPVMLGAYSPTEAQTVHQSGADFVKLFPADTLGPAYIKALRAPLPHLKIVPTGGVTLENVAEFFKAGCPAVGVGSSLISAAILEKNDWAALRTAAAQFVARVPTSKPS